MLNLRKLESIECFIIKAPPYQDFESNKWNGLSSEFKKTLKHETKEIKKEILDCMEP